MRSPGIRQLLSGTTLYSSVEICIFRHEIVGVKKMQPTTMGAFGSCKDGYKNRAITVFMATRQTESSGGPGVCRTYYSILF